MGRNKDSKLQQFSCPVCKSVVKPKDSKAAIDEWSSALQNNLILSTMIARNKEDQQPACGSCKRHQQQSVAKFWCKECDETFCDKCNTMHSWMKLLSTHLVVAIEDLGSNTCGIDLHAVSELCNTHTANNIEAFCFNHEKLCCIQCVFLNHRCCEKVKSIEEINASDDVYSTIHDKLESIKMAAIKLLKEKEQQKSNLKAMAENTEEEAKEFVDKVKSNIDFLFETFKKQLHIFRDDENTGFNIRIRLLEQLIKNLDHWISVDRVLGEFGTRKQQFIYVDTLKKQLKASVKHLNKVTRNDALLNLQFEKNVILAELLKTTENIGIFNKIAEHDLAGQADDVYKCCEILGVKLHPAYENLRVELIETFHFDGPSLQCGVCIGNDHIVLGNGSGSLHIVDKKTGTVINTTKVSNDSRRLCYDKEQNQMFISGSCQSLCKAEIVGDAITDPKPLIFNHDYVGALCKYGKHVYIVVDNAVKKFPSTAKPESSEEMSTVITTNTDCGLTGMNIFRRQIIVTTKNSEIKCTNLQGDDIYCFKNEAIKTPECISTLPAGLTLVVDRANNGSLHVLTKDGTKHKTLLEKFDTITDPYDIWLDNDDDEIFYVCGGENMEKYRIICD